MKKAETFEYTLCVLEQDRSVGQSGRAILAVSSSMNHATEITCHATQVTCHAEASAVTCTRGNSDFFLFSPSDQRHFGSWAGGSCNIMEN